MTKALYDHPDPEVVEHRKQWIAELRSGKRDQGFGRLKTRKPHEKPKFCCLGVATELSGVKSAATDLRIGTDNSEVVYGYGIEGNTGLLPPTTQKWLGISKDNPGINIYYPARDDGAYFFRLANLNDYLHLTFDQIADLAEYFGII